MRHRRDGRKLGITASHRKAMLANMVTSLFDSERIQTTVPKAKEARRLAERLITFARRGNAAAVGGHEEKRLAARRHVARTVHDSEILRKLFNEIAPRFADRPGGYTRILRLGSVRVGDSARRAILELVKKDEEKRKKKKTPRKTYHKVEMPSAPAEREKTRPAAAPAEGAAEASATAAEGQVPAAEGAAQATAPATGGAHAKGAAPAKAPKAEAAAAPKKEKAHKTEADKASGEKKAKAKAAESKPKGKKE
jgi:large subunit ribosomal protein L17